MNSKIRLQKFLSMAGVASRRDAEKMILEGRVKVNGSLVRKMGTKVDPQTDRIAVDNDLIQLKEAHIYYLLNKPAGYLTTTRDPYQRPTVFDLIPPTQEHLFAVGRLDFDTEGILLITSDGELAYRLMHPRFKINKTYLALTYGIVPLTKLNLISKGIPLKDGKTAPAQVKLIKTNQKQNTSWLKITVHEGKKRQIKEMCRYIGHPVRYLKRISFAFLELGNLEPGASRPLNEEEVARLYKLVGLS